MSRIYQGTRNKQGFIYSHPASRLDNDKYTRDVGMNRRVTITGLFSGSLISDSAGVADFSVFKADDQITIWGTQLNNGRRIIVSVSSGSLTVDFPVQTEGPVASVEVRTV